METASRVMYSIANIFNWILAIFYAAGIVLSALVMAGVMQNVNGVNLNVGTLVGCIIGFIVALIIIALVRTAKAKNTSKGWDILFIVLGVLEVNPFYILGGIFGVVAPR